jgi:hypothetical protein
MSRRYDLLKEYLDEQTYSRYRLMRDHEPGIYLIEDRHHTYSWGKYTVCYSLDEVEEAIERIIESI